MNTQRTRSRTGWLLASLALLTASAVQAQTPGMPIAPAPAAPNDEIIELSPFQVSPDSDTGYRATSTMAGTRMRTSLRDVAGSISVVTKDFMNDIAANNLEDLLTYTAGTEVDGLSGNFSGSGANPNGFQEFTNAIRSPTSTTRVRGLGAADNTRDYFITDAPLDGYNIDRVEVNRGPNAMLFGLGSPGGIINQGLIKALANKTKTKLETQFDQEGSWRFVLDHNQVLKKDVLALRFATLQSDQQFQIKQAFIKNERYFLTGTWRPWKGAELRVNAEQAEQTSNKAVNTTPMDSYTWWWEMGKPVYNPTTDMGSYLGTPSPNLALRPFKTDGSGGGSTQISPTNRPASLTGGIEQGGGLHLVAEDPTSSRLGVTGLDPSVMAIEFANDRGRLTSSGGLANLSMRRLSNSQEYMRQTHTDQPLLYPFWRDQRLSDPTIFDFYHDMLEGPNKREWAIFDTRNINFSQQLGSHAGFELVYDWQKMNNGYYQPLQFRQTRLNIDINTHLPNGMANPNFGRPMTTTAFGSKNSSTSERESYRATAFYELDFTNGKTSWLSKLLGRHIFTGSDTRSEQDIRSFGGRINTIGTDYAAAQLINSPENLPARTATNPHQVFTIGDQRRQIMRTYYHGPSLLSVTSPTGSTAIGSTAMQNLDGLSKIKVLYYERPPSAGTAPRTLGAYKVGTFSLVPDSEYDFSNTDSGSKSYNVVESLAFVANSYWWDSTLVTTVGWRQDDYKAASGNAVPVLPDGSWNQSSDVWTFGPESSIEGERINYGIVLHLPPSLRGKLPWNSDISLAYNKSDNFQVTGQRWDIYDNPLPPVGGETHEYTLMLSMFSNKLELRGTKFETATVNANAGYTEVQNRIWRGLVNQLGVVRNTDYRSAMAAAGFGSDLAAWDQWEKSPEAQALFGTYRIVLPTTPNNASTPAITHVGRITDVVATRSQVAEGYEFDVTYNPTPQWRISFNLAEQITVNSDSGTQVRMLMDDIAPVWKGTAGRIAQGYSDGSPGSDDLANLWTSINIDAAKIELLDGGPTPEQRRWRYNVVTNYTFMGGKLNNVRIGGAYRWQDKVAIGYPIILSPDGINGIYDVQHPYYGKSEGNFDLWIGYSHVFSKQKIRWNVQLNVKNVGRGNELIAVSTQPDGTVDSPRLATPQLWSLTNTFEF